MKISSRRYIGCKTKLLDNIYNEIYQLGYDSSFSFADIFAGTGVVGSYFANKGYNVLLNDTLYSNFVAYNAFHLKDVFDDNKIKKYLDYFNNLKVDKLEDNYFSNIYGNKYFSKNDAKLIGFIREYIENEKNNLSKKEYYYLITSLMYCADKIANTVGHFESFLHKDTIDKGVILKELTLDNYVSDVEIYNEDANSLCRTIKYDIVYLDPPYNARQYINFYHVLENLARWNKPKEFEGNSMKFKRNELKSDYCRNNAPILFKDLIDSLDCKLIVVSYNNTYTASSTASNNKITENQLLEILAEKGKVFRKEIKHTYFNAGKTNFSNHLEYLYICEVNKNENY